MRKKDKSSWINDYEKERIRITQTYISIKIDEDIKLNAQELFSEMGLNLTTAIDLFLRTVLIERRLPFEIRNEQVCSEDVNVDYINTKLDKSMKDAIDPNTKWLTQDEMLERINKRRKARSHVLSLLLSCG
ncbi:MAG: type II toxin-antitoxin system RelB/DinJ family antitoxin [Lachnospiraceae bacterium]|jgi:DNA-damage-inducible protein J|nr:type II toxin-antitoxin system RelB/DinJ family antitoxin [Lachnospiraceae bacterium]